MRTSATVHILEMGHTSEQEIGITLHILESASQACETGLVKIQTIFTISPAESRSG